MPEAWSAKYKGHFDHGWDRVREETFQRQKALGVVPPDAELTPRPAEIQAWADVDAAMRPVLARQMEVYAGFLEHTDHHVGRLVDVLEEQGVLDDTLVYYIVGDNGASAEGTPSGTFNELLMLNGLADVETPEFMAERIDGFGTPASFNHYAVGWAHAMDTPYQWTKQIASHWGGTRNGTIVHWPSGIGAAGEVRSQFCHVIDIAPTVLDVAGLPEPTFVHGVQQAPLHGTSMRYSFDDGGASERHTTQYFEMIVNRGIYRNGWAAVTKHGTLEHRRPLAAAIGPRCAPYPRTDSVGCSAAAAHMLWEPFGFERRRLPAITLISQSGEGVDHRAVRERGPGQPRWSGSDRDQCTLQGPASWRAR